MRSGKVAITGGDNVLSAPTNGEADDASDASWDGMLFFQAYGNTANFKITGNSLSSYAGTIFVPDGHCTLVGEGGSTALDTQFVCDTIDIAGNADIILSYTQTDKYFPPPPITISPSISVSFNSNPETLYILIIIPFEEKEDSNNSDKPSVKSFSVNGDILSVIKIRLICFISCGSCETL